MTTTDTPALPSDRAALARADFISQSTAVEQARAVAEVQAQILVAQSVPRDVRRAEVEMIDACSKLSLANRAFYRVPNRGSGASVHLARELARIWGNVQYGVHELRRDDDAGESEIQAFAWDVQTNTRSTRTFIVPHARMAQGSRKKLTDLNDIYLSNQNIGARAVRECIFTVLPTAFVEAAQDTCRRTIEHGEGTPIAERIETMLAKFRESFSVSQAQLENKTGRKRGQWDGGTIAEMTVLYQSLQRGEVTVDEEFPSVGVTGAEISEQAKPKGSES